MKQLVIVEGGRSSMGIIYHLLVADTGEHLASHICSAKAFAEGDLYYNRPERIKDLKERFGEVKVDFLKDTDISEEEMLKRNGEWYKTLEF